MHVLKGGWCAGIEQRMGNSSHGLEPLSTWPLVSSSWPAARCLLPAASLVADASSPRLEAPPCAYIAVLPDSRARAGGLVDGSTMRGP